MRIAKIILYSQEKSVHFVYLVTQRGHNEECYDWRKNRSRKLLFGLIVRFSRLEEDRKLVCVRDDFIAVARNLAASFSVFPRIRLRGISYSCGKVRLGIHGRKYEL